MVPLGIPKKEMFGPLRLQGLQPGLVQVMNEGQLDRWTLSHFNEEGRQNC